MKISWRTDLLDYIDSVKYGEADLKISRLHGRTVNIQTIVEETLTYTDNQVAMESLMAVIFNLIENKISGEESLRLTLKDGNIILIGFKSTKQTQYGKK